jgi:hypothetical protein
MLSSLLQDQKLFLVHEEAKNSEKGFPEASRLFNRSALLPLHILLMIKRKELISDIKLLMPFWYSVPIISRIIAFFTHIGSRKKPQSDEEEDKTLPAAPDTVKELQNTAKEAEEALVPKNYTIDTYLEELISRWGRLVNKQAKENLVEDVNSLIRDRLRHILRFQKNNMVNRDTLDKITGAIIQAPGLQKISEQNALFLYVKLYLVKLLLGKNLITK